MGEDRALRSGVENARGPVHIAHDRCNADRQGRARNLSRGIKIHRRMFQVDKHPMEAAGFGDLWNLHGAQPADIEAGGDLAVAKALLDGIFDDGHAVFSPRILLTCRLIARLRGSHVAENHNESVTLRATEKEQFHE